MLIAASCSSGADSKDSSDSVQPTDPTAASTAGAAPTTEPTAIEAPTTAPSAELAISTPRAAFDVVLAWMNGAEVVEGEYTTVFAEPFVSAIPFADFQALAVDTAADGPWTFAATLGEDASGGAYEVTSAAGEASVVQLEIDAAQRQITASSSNPKQSSRRRPIRPKPSVGSRSWETSASGSWTQLRGRVPRCWTRECSK